jgi:hypothetical protein
VRSLLLLCCLLWFQDADPPARDLDALRAQRLAETREEIGQLRSIPPVPIKELIRLEVKDGLIELRTSVPPTDGRVSILTPDWNGLSVLWIEGDGQEADGFHSPRAFLLHHRSFSMPGQIEVHTHVTAQPGVLTVARDMDGIRTQTSVQLIQNPIVAEAPDKVLRLYVQETDSLTGERLTDVKVSAGSWDELRRSHPREVQTYLAPILADLGHDKTLLRIDPRLAWQVLAEGLSPDEATRARVMDLLKGLDDPRYASRKEAADALEAIGQPAAAVLATVPPGSLSPQQEVAVTAFLAPFRPADPNEVARLQRDRDFLMDCLACDELTLRIAAADRLKALSGEILFDPYADEATRTEQIARLRARLTR